MRLRRCRESLEVLTEVAAQAPGLSEVVSAGRPASAVFPDLGVFEGRPGVTYHGEFSSEEELGRMFGSVDFAWGIDFYEKDANSLWLLPNRLYRAVYYGVPPIALGSVETGRWLKERGVGLILDRFDAGALRQALEAVTPERQAALAQAVRDIPTS